jgi:hypothetical protein
MFAAAPKPKETLQSTQIYFEPNQGQFDPQVRFLARGAKYQAWITDSKLVLQLSKGEAPVTIQFGPASAAKRKAEGLEKQPGTSSYFYGRNEAKWITGVPSYSRARLADVYPGIDVVFYGRDDKREIEYDFVVKPGADPSQISIDFDPKFKPKAGAFGEVTMDLPGGKLRHEIPSVHTQTGKPVEYAARFDGSRLRFDFGGYDRSQTLIVDPAVAFSTYISTSGNDAATGVAVDPQGNTYIAGKTVTANFPLSNFADSANANEFGAAYVVKIAAAPLSNGTYPRLYSAYFGATLSSPKIAVDSAGAAYITGEANGNFPVRNAFQPNTVVTQGQTDGFLAKISATPGNAGHTLIYSTYLGGRIRPTSIAVSADGSAYVAATGDGRSFLSLNSGVRALPPAGLFDFADALVTRVAATPSNNGVYDRVYGIAYGGEGSDWVRGIAVDSTGAAYITGGTSSNNIPLIGSRPRSGLTDGFVAKISGTPVSGNYGLVYSTFIGGNEDDDPTGIAVDANGAAYIIGTTGSPNFPTRLPLQSSLRGPSDTFVAVLDGAAPYGLLFGTYWGGDSAEFSAGIALGATGRVYITGNTTSGGSFGDFPLADPVILPAKFGAHAFAASFSVDATASRVEYSTHLDRTGASPYGIAADAAGNAHIVGATTEPDFPVFRGVAGPTVPATQISSTLPYGFAVKLSPVASGNTVAVTSVIPGRKFTTAGANCNSGQYTAPQLFAWAAGTSCLVTFDELEETSNTIYSFSTWSDGSPLRSRTVVSGAGLQTVTAVYREAYALATSSILQTSSGQQSLGPTGLVTPAAKAFYPSGTKVTVTARSDANFSFAYWNGAVPASSAVSIVTMDRPWEVAAVYEAVPTQRGAALQFVPIAPCRVVDSRTAGGTIAALGTRDVSVVGTCGIPAGAAAFALNVTVVPKGPLGFLTIWPKGKPRPVVSTLNSLDGRIKANAAVVPAGDNGAVSVYVTDQADVVVDVNGYFAPPSATTLAYFPITACRLVDTRRFARPGPGLPAQTSVRIQVQGDICGIPASARAYGLNATVIPNGTLGFLTLRPAGTPLPTVSTLNATTGTLVANAAIVQGSNDGAIEAYATDNTEMVLDVTGYFAPANSGAGGMNFYTLDPCRLTDSRTIDFPLQRNEPTSIRVDGLQSCQVPVTARAISSNITVVPQPVLGYLTAWNGEVPRPEVSTLNALDGAITSNASFLGIFIGRFGLFGNGFAHYIVDVNGYFATY